MFEEFIINVLKSVFYHMFCDKKLGITKSRLFFNACVLASVPLKFHVNGTMAIFQWFEHH